MEALSRMMAITESRGLVDGFSVGSRYNVGIVVSHLLFVDDTLIFCGANEEHIRNLRCLFLGFESVSGFKINLSKLEIIPIDEVDDKDSFG
jgi:hypothetical protein